MQVTFTLMVPVPTKVHKHIGAHSFPHINYAEIIYFVVQLANIFKVRYYIIAKHNLLNSGVKLRGVQILSIWLPG